MHVMRAKSTIAKMVVVLRVRRGVILRLIVLMQVMKKIVTKLPYQRPTLDMFQVSKQKFQFSIALHLNYKMKIYLAQSRNQAKMVISLDLEIWAVLSISEVEELFCVKFKLTLTWKDPRLTFLNLKEDSSMNIVSPVEAAKIWYPVVVFMNTRKMDLSKVIVFSRLNITPYIRLLAISSMIFGQQ